MVSEGEVGVTDASQAGRNVWGKYSAGTPGSIRACAVHITAVAVPCAQQPSCCMSLTTPCRQFRQCWPIRASLFCLSDGFVLTASRTTGRTATAVLIDMAAVVADACHYMAIMHHHLLLLLMLQPWKLTNTAVPTCCAQTAGLQDTCMLASVVAVCHVC